MTNTSLVPEVAHASLLRDKVVLITGASRGIGAAAARLFAAEGATVVLGARSTAALERIVVEIQEHGGTAYATPVDLADTDAIRAAVVKAGEFAGRLDGAFNNAGIVQQPGPLEATSAEDIEAQFAH